MSSQCVADLVPAIDPERLYSAAAFVVQEMAINDQPVTISNVVMTVHGSYQDPSLRAALITHLIKAYSWLINTNADRGVES